MQWQKIQTEHTQFGSFSITHPNAPAILVNKALQDIDALSFETAYDFYTGQTSALKASLKDSETFFLNLHILHWMCGRVKKALKKEDLLTLAAFLGVEPLSWRQSDVLSDIKVADVSQVVGLLDQFCEWLDTASEHPPALAAESVHALLFIHPFERKMSLFAQWMISLILIHRGYPPPLFDGPLTFSKEAICEDVSKGLYAAMTFSSPVLEEELLKAVILPRKNAHRPSLTKNIKENDRFKIGTLSKKVNETVPTLRYWTKEGLLQAVSITDSGYHLYGSEAVERVRLIQKMKHDRLTLCEIRNKLLIASQNT